MQPFRVGDWLVEPMINQISGGGTSIRVEPKVMDVLVMLSRSAGSVVTREQLFDEVWSGTVVTDDVLTRSVSELRKVFRDSRREPRYIETIQKTGYRLVAPVGPAEELAITPGDPGSIAGTSRSGVSGGLPISIVALSALIGLLLLVVWWITGRTDTPVRAPLYPVPVTSYPGRESRFDLSPDGKQVAFAWQAENDESADIYVKYVDAAPVLRLTNDTTTNSNPAWSPDGTEVAFIHRGAECEIRIVSAIGGRPRTLGSCGANMYGDLTWSPDGSWLAFNDRDRASSPFSIYFMNPATGESRQTTSPPSGIWGDHDPFFSPDGRQLGIVRSASEGMQDVYVLEISSGDERRVTSEARNVWGGTWSEDGAVLVVSSNRTGRPALWQVDPNSGEMTWLSVQSPAAGFPDVAAGRLAFIQMETDVNLWRVSLVGDAPPAPFVPSTYWDLHPAISPDGSQIAFSSNRSGAYEIWIADADGGSLRQLTTFGGAFTSTPRWSPDGSRLVFTGRPDGNADIYVIGLNGPSAKRITYHTADDLAPDWSVDGDSILFTSNRTGRWETWRVSIDNPKPEQVTFTGSFGARPSADGTGLLFSQSSEPGLWRMDLRNGATREIIPVSDPRDWGSWRQVGEKVYYVDRTGRDRILRNTLDTAHLPDTVFVPRGQIPVMDPSLDISPDERWMLVGQIDRQESDIMVVDLH